MGQDMVMGWWWIVTRDHVLSTVDVYTTQEEMGLREVGEVVGVVVECSTER